MGLLFLTMLFSMIVEDMNALLCLLDLERPHTFCASAESGEPMKAIIRGCECCVGLF